MSSSASSSSQSASSLDASSAGASSLEGWRRRVADELGLAPDAVDEALGRVTVDGLAIPPLHVEERFATGADPAGFPGRPPYTRGVALPDPSAGADDAWLIALEIDDPSPADANEALLAGLALGVRVPWLRIAPQDGGAAERTGIRWRTVDDVLETLHGVEPSYVEIVLDSDAASSVVPLYDEALRRRGVDPSGLAGALGAEPLGCWARRGCLDVEGAYAALVESTRWCADRAPNVDPLVVDASPWHDAGAGPAEQVACALAAALEALRRLETADSSLARFAAARTVLALSVTDDVFLEIAALRAGRQLWWRLLDAAGHGEAAESLWLHARGSARTATRVDPWVNMLRGSAQTFAAVLGGARSIATPCWDRRLGRPSAQARRLAVTTQHVLAEESHLGRVVDPAGGSWAIEWLTDEIARRAWALLGELEDAGGLAACLRDGSIQERLAASAARRRRRVATREQVVVGVSMYANLDESRPQPRDDEALREVYGTSDRTSDDSPDLPTVDRLVAVHDAEPFERLRLASDRAPARPCIALVLLGAPRDHRARADFARDLYAAGGVGSVPLPTDGASVEDVFTELARSSDLRAAVLCSSDAVYADRAVDAARALRAAGAEIVHLAGRPGTLDGALEDELRTAGVDDFIFHGCDAVAVLEGLLGALGVDLPASRSNGSADEVTP